MPIQALKSLSEDQVDRIIHMAWTDRTSFESIHQHTGLTESDVIHLMRGRPKRKSFNIWRQRVSGRTTKHRKRFRAEREYSNRQISVS